MKTLIYAHRGASSVCPENTIESFSLAVEQKADAIELDVHLTKDGEIVVAHDSKLERVSDGTGHINDYTLKELRSFNFGKLFPEGPVCRIPLMAEVFALIKTSALTINIELKTTELQYRELPEKLISLAKEYSMGERIIYSSFNHYSLRQIKNIDPCAKTGLLYQFGMVDPWVYADYVNACAIHPHYRVIAEMPEIVTLCHKNGIMVNVWTVDDPQIIGQMLQNGVDGIISNKPDVAIACRDEFIRGNKWAN